MPLIIIVAIIRRVKTRYVVYVVGIDRLRVTADEFLRARKGIRSDSEGAMLLPLR